MRLNLRFGIFVLFVLCGPVFCFPKKDSKDLNITPVMQQTPVWCWLASGEMIFRHYDIPNLNPVGVYQCGIIGALAGPASPCWYDCRICNVPAGSTQNMQRMLSDYPRIARQLTNDSNIPLISSSVKFSSLTKSQIIDELDNDRPILVGINPSGFAVPGSSQHAAVIVGYDEDDDNNMELTVNDPFPYDYVGYSGLLNPYQRAGGQNNYDGSYTIDYQNFKTYLTWNTSIYKIE